MYNIVSLATILLKSEVIPYAAINVMVICGMEMMAVLDIMAGLMLKSPTRIGPKINLSMSAWHAIIRVCQIVGILCPGITVMAGNGDGSDSCSDDWLTCLILEYFDSP